MTTKAKLKKEIRAKNEVIACLEKEIKDAKEEIAYLKAKEDIQNEDRIMRGKIESFGCKKGEWCDVCKFGYEVEKRVSGMFFRNTICKRAMTECHGFVPIEGQGERKREG